VRSQEKAVVKGKLVKQCKSQDGHEKYMKETFDEKKVFEVIIKTTVAQHTWTSSMGMDI
jgi:hypothetical protein